MPSAKPGRPREFDIEDALDSAIQVFWSKGYDGASLSDLTAALGVTRPSLYAAFGDKRGLFLSAIERYASTTECPPILAFEAEGNIKKAVHAFLSTSIEEAPPNQQGQRGCFLGTCVATNAGEVEGVQELLRRSIEQTDSRLAARFDREKEKKKLPSGFPSRERARLMFDLRQGFALRSRSGIDAGSMKSDLKKRVAIVLA